MAEIVMRGLEEEFVRKVRAAAAMEGQGVRGWVVEKLSGVLGMEGGGTAKAKAGMGEEPGGGGTDSGGQSAKVGGGRRAQRSALVQGRVGTRGASGVGGRR